ncbi:MAG: N-acetylglucosamine-6-phosphate deacetylase [Hungatella sp.]
MKTLIQGGRIYRKHEFVQADILLQDGIIQEIGRNLSADGAEIFDASDGRVVPGFMDIHTHGAVNVDVNGATAEDLEKICCFFATQGTTEWLCSVLTDTREQTLWCIEQYNRWKTIEHRGAQLMGIHLEGPFLSPDYKGAMPEHLLQKTNLDLLKEYQAAAHGEIRYITVSPEIEGVVEAIPQIKQLGMQVAIGHSGADYDTARQAIKNGAMAATHTGNAMKLLHQHFPAIWGAVLEDNNLYCEVICDGRHLHPGTVRLILKTKGLSRVVAITDSIMATGLPDGHYKLGVNDIVVIDGDAKLADGGSRAGSTLTTGTALLNLLAYTGKPLEDILPLLTENPAKLIGVSDRVGFLEIGKNGNLVILTEDNRISDTFVNGKICQKKGEFIC